MKNKNLAECILFSVFMIIGITFIIIGGIWYYIVREKENTWVSTQATIIDIEKSEIYNSKIVWVEFSIKNHIYQVELPEYYSSMKIGKDIMIYYNPSNPNEIIIKNFLGHLIFIGMGVVFTIIGLTPTILKIFKNRKKKNLMRNGKKIEATIDNISFKMNYSVNGRHPYILECSYVDLETGAVYFFKSDSVWYSIETLLEHNNITTVPVYVDTKNLKKYIHNSNRRKYMKKKICIITVLLSFLLVGCNAGKTLTNTPTRQVEIFLNKYQTLDKDVLDDLDKVIANEENFTGEHREKYRDMMKSSYQKLAYQIKDEKVDGDTATVTAEIEVVDYGKLLSSANVYLEDHREEFQDENGEYDVKKFIDYRLEKMKDNKEKVKYTIDFHLTKKNEEWKLDDLSKTDEQKIQGIYQY